MSPAGEPNRARSKHSSRVSFEHAKTYPEGAGAARVGARVGRAWGAPDLADGCPDQDPPDEAEVGESASAPEGGLCSANPSSMSRNSGRILDIAPTRYYE